MAADQRLSGLLRYIIKWKENNIMKKTIALTLAAAMTASVLTGCGSGTSSGSKSETAQNTQADSGTKAQEDAPAADGSAESHP